MVFTNLRRHRVRASVAAGVVVLGMAAILLGLGYQFLSMNVAAIPWVKKVVRSVRMQDAVELADLVMQQPTAALARKAAESFMHERFADLMAEL